MALSDVRECSEALPDVQEALSNVRECSGDRHRCPGVVGTSFRMFGVVRSPSRMSGSGQKAIPNVWEWLGGPLGYP